MTLTVSKREKLLLEIVFLVGAFALIWVFLVMPAQEEKIALEVEQESTELELQEKERLLMNDTLESAYQDALTEAKENYDYFYSVLNSYTIDEILNTLIKEHGISVVAMNISEYEDAAYDFPETAEELDVLVKSIVNLTVTGEYQNILNFMDAMNAKSTCLRMDMVNISENTQDATGAEGMIANFRIYIYGIDIILEELQDMQ